MSSNDETLRELATAARELVCTKPSLVMCHRWREEDFEPGIGCECSACKAAQKLFDLLEKVPR